MLYQFFGLLLSVIGFFIYYTTLKYAKPTLLFPVSSNDKIPDQTGKVAIVTGANAGIGFETCKELIRVGATCIAASRTQKKADENAKKLNSFGYKGKAIGMELELDDHKSIYQFSKNFRQLGLPLHMLILNAGMMGLPHQETKDGLEIIAGVNFVGHYYLNLLLQDVLEASQPSRVVVVTSNVHEIVAFGLPDYSVIQGESIKKHYEPVSPKTYIVQLESALTTLQQFWQYGVSKLFNIYHVQEMTERMKKENKNVLFVAVHPGVISTELGRNVVDVDGIFQKIWGLLLLNTNQGAVTQLYAATTNDNNPFQRLAGKYMVPQARVEEPSSYAKNIEVRKRIIKEAETIISKWEK